MGTPVIQPWSRPVRLRELAPGPERYELSPDAAQRAAIADLAPLWPRLRLGVTINLPLALLLQPELASWLGQAIGFSALAPGGVVT